MGRKRDTEGGRDIGAEREREEGGRYVECGEKEGHRGRQRYWGRERERGGRKVGRVWGERGTQRGAEILGQRERERERERERKRDRERQGEGGGGRQGEGEVDKECVCVGGGDGGITNC